MEEMIFVKPKNGIKIRRPDSGSMLLEDGESVPKDNFWARRILDGDVELVDHKDVKEEHAKSKSSLASKIFGGEQ